MTSPTASRCCASRFPDGKEETIYGFSTRAVQMLEDWEAQQDNEPIFDVDMHKVDGKPFCAGDVRAEAIRWCEAVVRLYGHRTSKAIA